VNFINGFFKLITALTGAAELAKAAHRYYVKLQENRKAKNLKKKVENADTTEELADASKDASRLFNDDSSQ
jgi:uncharacterized metal-binding protein